MQSQYFFLLSLGSTLHSFTSCAVDYTDEWEIPRDHLEIGQKIGEGQFGLVLEGTLITGELILTPEHKLKSVHETSAVVGSYSVIKIPRTFCKNIKSYYVSLYYQDILC